jgi:hypothetical protein
MFPKKKPKFIYSLFFALFCAAMGWKSINRITNSIRIRFPCVASGSIFVCHRPNEKKCVEMSIKTKYLIRAALFLLFYCTPKNSPFENVKCVSIVCVSEWNELSN